MKFITKISLTRKLIYLFFNFITGYRKTENIISYLNTEILRDDLIYEKYKFKFVKKEENKTYFKDDLGYELVLKMIDKECFLELKKDNILFINGNEKSKNVYHNFLVDEIIIKLVRVKSNI